MKKLLIGCLGLVAALVLAIGVVVMVIPGDYESERSLVVAASADEVFAVVSDLHTWPDWTVWGREMDPDCVWSYNDKVGVGARTDWKGPILGGGYIVTTEVIDGSRFGYDLGFLDDQGAVEVESKGFFELAPAGEDTLVRWGMYGEMEGLNKLFGLLIDSAVGPEFEQGLANLNARFEAAE